MMLRTRSRAVGSKQGLISDSPSVQSPTENQNKRRSSSLFPSPRLSLSLSVKGFSDTEAAMSPTSILEAKHLSSVGSPFFSNRTPRKPPSSESTTCTHISTESRLHSWGRTESKAISLGLVDVLDKPEKKKSSMVERRMVLFGSKLKIQIPSDNANSIYPTGTIESPYSPIEFGVKNKDSQLALLSPVKRSLMMAVNSGSEAAVSSSPRVFTGSISPSEMELSEDYTCVISHGPNPRTTHIFDNCIIRSCGDVLTPWKESRIAADHGGSPSNDFLSFCHACKKSLGQGADIFMYRGEKSFCSNECRDQEMQDDEEEMEKEDSI
ncbi:FCS-Like Zinc finger 8-like [Typha latifolia]|uniref:FCS-Like Zinc finger 8-like n=1 Tax=Typha latifolia TaxID=4733 RepID=UPI003C30B973